MKVKWDFLFYFCACSITYSFVYMKRVLLQETKEIKAQPLLPWNLGTLSFILSLSVVQTQHFPKGQVWTS